MDRRMVLASIGTAVSATSLAGCSDLASSVNPSSEEPVSLERVTVENEAPSERQISVDVVYDATVEHTIVETIPAGKTLTITDEWPNEAGPFVVLCHSDTDNNYHLMTLDTRQARQSDTNITGYEIKFRVSKTGDVSGDIHDLTTD